MGRRAVALRVQMTVPWLLQWPRDSDVEPGVSQRSPRIPSAVSPSALRTSRAPRNPSQSPKISPGNACFKCQIARAKSGIKA